MNRRLLDHYMLIDARIVSSKLDVHQIPVGNVEINVQVQVGHEHGIAQGPQEGPAQLIQSRVSAQVSVRQKDEDQGLLYSVSVQVQGTFALLHGDPISIATLEGGQHALARMLFPLARGELSQTMSRAKLPDIPISWDLGPPPVQAEAASAPTS